MRSSATAFLFALVCLSAGCTSLDPVPCRVESNPTTAEVWVGAEHRDTTPCELLFYTPGEYEVFLKKPGYMTIMRRVTVLEGADPETGDALLTIHPAEMVVTMDPLEGAPPASTRATPQPEPARPYYE